MLNITSRQAHLMKTRFTCGQIEFPGFSLCNLTSSQLNLTSHKIIPYVSRNTALQIV